MQIAWWKQDTLAWLSIIPIICFGFQGHISAVPLYAELRGRSLQKFDVVILASLLACLVAYNMTGFMGYASFGSRTKNDIILNMDQKRPEVIVARIAVATSVITT